MPVRVLVADDHPIVCDGIKRLSKASEIKIVGAVETLEALSDSVKKLCPDVLVTEVRVGGDDVMKLLEAHSTEKSGCRLLFFSANSNPTNIARASTLDCYDYLLKSSSTGDLIKAIKDAAAGKPTPENSLIKKSRKRIRETSKWDRVEVPLTHREKQVLQHVAMGLSNREIGRSLGISVETVKEHVQNTLRKLDANDRTQAAVWAVRGGLI